MKEFAAAAGRSAANNDVPLTFKLGEQEITAKPPSVGQLALFIQGSRLRGLRAIDALFKFLSDVLDDEDWEYVENELRDGLDVGVLNEIAAWMIEEWSARPTSPRSASSPTRSTTGSTSTGKRRSKVPTT